MTGSYLFSAFRLRGLELANRIVVAPMGQYSAIEGSATDWHLMHLGQFAVAGPELWLASVGTYNVVLDLTASRLQHGCRDFQGQVQERRLCKHVAGLLLAIDAEVAVAVLERIVDPAGDWHLEAMTARGFGK